ncbi:MAG: LAGLIDADG family homing endonuclease [Nanoarchaeota archaeon]|nr:LAGLIDADG family homing endonuclease [Nanoarchaeota archaeon]
MVIDKKKPDEEIIAEAKLFFETYKKEVGDSIRKGRKVVFVNFSDIASNSPILAESIIASPEEKIDLLSAALEDTGLIHNPIIRFNDLPETQRVKIRTIRANHLNQLIFFEGLVRQASDVRPQVVNARFECPSCGTVISVLQIEKKFREPNRCSCGRKGAFTLLSKTMVDAQRLVIEESPDSLTGGEQPRRINVFLKEDLVEPIMEEKTTPGSKVKVLGILKEVPIPLPTGSISTRFDLAVEANNLIPLESTYEDLDISEEDERQILELSTDPEIFKKLRDSIAPSIWGYEQIKEALVLQMFGGVRKTSPDGTVSRGDIHLFLIGDPGVAKSIGKDEKVMYISDKETGYDSIENIYNKFGKGPNNLKVLTINQEFHEPRWEYVNEIIKHLPEKDLIKLITKHGKEIIATKDHSFITLSKNGDIVSIKGDELTKNSYIPIPINYHKEVFKHFLPGHFNKNNTNSKLLLDKIDLNEDFGFFIGIFLSEGYIKNEKTIDISNRNKDIQNKVINFAKKINLNLNINEKGVQIFSKNLSDILKSYCYYESDLKNIKKGIKGNYSKIKKIPGFAFFSPKEFIYGLLSGLFSGGGRLIKDKKMLKGFELITISKDLAEDTSDLLFSIGILNKLKKRTYSYKENKADYYSVSVPTYMIKRFLDNIKIYGRVIKLNEKDPIYSYNDLIPCGELVYEIVKKLGYNSRKNGNRTLASEMRTVKKRNEIGRIRLLKLINEFEKKDKNKINELFILKKIANSNLVWSKIISIEDLKKKNEEVYDLSIPSTNTFVANGIGVHNSVTLKFISNMAPRGRYIVGKAATGAGITATVVKDEFLKGWALEAGAMVLANKGIICIDEIEKMDPTDRSAMHEALEQQTVTISKANVQATLTAQTSVLAAGNPKYGRFEPTLPITQQIDLPPALINRFDLIFILRDLPDKVLDESIATHVLNLHRRRDSKSPLDRELFRKYVAYSKQRIEPKLTDESVNEIKDFYMKMRSMETIGESATIAISARQLQGLVRLAEAHAKMRLSTTVDREDSQAAIRLTNYYLMQVGYDPETKTFDIDRFSTRVSSSQRSKIMLLRETIKKLEEIHGKQIPLEVLRQEIGTNMTELEFEESIGKLKEKGDIYEPRQGFIQDIGSRNK